MATLPTPLPQLGPVKARWSAHRERSRATVAKLARQKCQSCQKAERHLDWAHLAGRRHIVAEPWASSPQLTMGLCRNCHRLIDQNIDLELRDELRRTGVKWLCEFAEPKGVNTKGLEQLSQEDPLAAIVQIVGRLEALGIEPNCCPSHETRLTDEQAPPNDHSA